ncbi:MAG: hypothetical protein K5880_11130 [Hydrogenophaga sp.]|jgi:hypothetical protein|uniref:hypothetical protein n=1 Tax=Hydrogenophaga sp. TaxID=1904254 RepID=UPI0026389418|nr:hypothetical protein [Hydrogenophaga sp.]MCV0439178.1 hypothetical protein [Hydrogenophaga sp.]
MFRRLSLIAIAIAVWAAGLAAIAWVAAAWLGRALSTGEGVLVGVALAIAVFVVVQGRLQRDRRKLQDMRDSALW